VGITGFSKRDTSWKRVSFEETRSIRGNAFVAGGDNHGTFRVQGKSQSFMMLKGSPGSGAIQTLLSHPGLFLSVQNLIELTLVISDNTAANVLLRLAGGPLAVTQFLEANSVDDIRIDRYTKYLVADR
jgi:hypothetical protein